MQKVAYFKDGNKNVEYEIMDKQARDDIAALPKDIIDKLTSPFSETGSIIQCHPVEEYPLDVSVNLEPIQEGSGDPYPAGGGKNKIVRIAETQTVNGITFTINPDESVTVNGTATATTFLNYGKVALTANTQYKLTSGISYTGVSVKFVNANVTADAGAINYTPTADDNDETIAVRVASGTVVTNLIVYPMVRIASDADGAYAPSSNIRPISGHTDCEVVRCGKNLINVPAKEQAYATFLYEKRKLDTPILPGTYTFSCKHNIPSGIGWWARFEDANGNTCGHTQTLGNTTFSKTIEITDEAASISIYVNGAVYMYDIQLELGSTATEYEPYHADTYPVEFGQTVYGADVGVSEGKTVVDYMLVTLTGEDGAKLTNVSGSRANMYYANFSGIDTPINNGYAADAISSHFKNDIWGSIITRDTFDRFAVSMSGSVGFAFNGTIDEANAWLKAQNAAGTPVQFVVKRKTSSTVVTSAHKIPGLKGTNTVYANAGPVTVNGRIDPEYLNYTVLTRLAALEAAAVN